ncbi:hypothetical protein QQM_1127 [Clostridioides difficile P2]|nr:hypothetical protein QCG_4150 [Clostridioides difficile CD43]EQI89559.1 hypothetical protein QQM_1127 [Clostridioides difficile P2]EQL11860.1 hypothetical protein QE3_4021 [Clostridioides difficile CD88]
MYIFSIFISSFFIIKRFFKTIFRFCFLNFLFDILIINLKTDIVNDFSVLLFRKVDFLI